MYSRMAPPAIAPIVRYRTVHEQLRPHRAPEVSCRADLYRALNPATDPLSSFTFASCKLSDQQMARIALLVYAGLLHGGTQVRKPAKYAAPQSLAKHLGNAAVLDRQERGVGSEEKG